MRMPQMTRLQMSVKIPLSTSPARRVSDTTPRERRELDPGTCCPDCGWRSASCWRGCQRKYSTLGGSAAQLKVLADRALEEILPPLREDGAGTRAQQTHPREHGKRGAVSLHSGVEIRRSYPALSLERNLRAHGRGCSRQHASRLVRGRAMKVLMPLIERIEADVMTSDLLHAG